MPGLDYATPQGLLKSVDALLGDLDKGRFKSVSAAPELAAACAADARHVLLTKDMNLAPMTLYQHSSLDDPMIISGGTGSMRKMSFGAIRYGDFSECSIDIIREKDAPSMPAVVFHNLHITDFTHLVSLHGSACVFVDCLIEAGHGHLLHARVGDRSLDDDRLNAGFHAILHCRVQGLKGREKAVRFDAEQEYEKRSNVIYSESAYRSASNIFVANSVFSGIEGDILGAIGYRMAGRGISPYENVQLVGNIALDCGALVSINGCRGLVVKDNVYIVLRTRPTCALVVSGSRDLVIRDNIFAYAPSLGLPYLFELRIGAPEYESFGAMLGTNRFDVLPGAKYRYIMEGRDELKTWSSSMTWMSRRFGWSSMPEEREDLDRVKEDVDVRILAARLYGDRFDVTMPGPRGHHDLLEETGEEVFEKRLRTAPAISITKRVTEMEVRLAAIERKLGLQ